MNQFLPPIKPGQGILLCGAISASLYASALWFQYVGELSPCSPMFVAALAAHHNHGAGGAGLIHTDAHALS